MDAFDATVEIVKASLQSSSKINPIESGGQDVANYFEAIYKKLKSIEDERTADL
jgi:hypothetical protein